MDAGVAVLHEDAPEAEVVAVLDPKVAALMKVQNITEAQACTIVASL